MEKNIVTKSGVAKSLSTVLGMPIYKHRDNIKIFFTILITMEKI